MPAHGWVRTPFCISYFIKNRSDYLITLRLTMEGSDAFMFAGQKQVIIKCLAYVQYTYKYITFYIIYNVCDALIHFFQVDINVLPRNVRKVDWVLRPLVAGFVALPTLSLTVSTGNDICFMEQLENFFNILI